VKAGFSRRQEQKMRIILASDIHGLPADADWLGEDLEVEVVRLSAAAGVGHLTGEALHHHLFSDGGMDAAAAHLATLGDGDVAGIGFSAGGTALWRAVAKGMALRALVCVSSTRLRQETSRLPIPAHTFWGGNDPNIPSETWRASMPTSSRIYEGLEHGFYQQPEAEASLRLRTEIRRTLGLDR
jgi:hypothetical protein